MNGSAIANGNGSVGVTPALSQVQLQPGSANLTTQSNVSVVPKNKEELNELLSKYYKLLFDSNKLKKNLKNLKTNQRANLKMLMPKPNWI